MTVNHRVVGSSPTRGAKKPEYALRTLVFFFGVFRRGNKPPVLPGDNKKLQQKKNLRDIIVNGLATALLEIYHGGF